LIEGDAAANGHGAGRGVDGDGVVGLRDLAADKRITPLEKDAAIWPVPELGSYTNLLITRSESGPTVKVEPSTRRTCTRPLSVVLMRSLKKIDLPILS
jgi:hypothetical protein